MRFRDLLLVFSILFLLVCPFVYTVSTGTMLFCVFMSLVSNFLWSCCEAIEQTKKEKNFLKSVDKSFLL